MFGEFLKKTRRSKGITQAYLAKVLNVSPAYICQLENGRTDAPSARRVRDIARILGLNPDELLNMANKERLRSYAKKQGMDTGDIGILAPSEEELGRLSVTERALVKLVRNLDPDTKKDFDGMLYMLLRHHPDENLQATLESYIKAS